MSRKVRLQVKAEANNANVANKTMDLANERSQWPSTTHRSLLNLETATKQIKKQQIICTTKSSRSEIVDPRVS